jgi:two-component system NtrC family sensor kinase
MSDIASEAVRCRGIIRSLLQFSRREKPRLARVDLSQIVDQVVRLRQYELGTRNVEVVRRFDPTGPVLSADPQKLQQVVLNLLNNAREALDEVTRPGRIEIRTRAESEMVVLEVLDNGSGIRDVERLFEPFYTTKEVGRGTGLGLAVCYGIVTEHGGEIHGENLEEGACFRVTLPRGRPETIEKSAPGLALAAPLAGFKALIVDDETVLLALQRSLLLQLGIESTGVTSGESAIRHLEENEVDLVISDVRMPGTIDGLALRDWVRSNRPRLIDKFIFVSGDLVGADSGEFSTDLSTPVLQKPFKLDEYARVIHDILTGESSSTGEDT